MNREQELIDIMFQIALTMKHESLSGLEEEELTQWIREQLEMCGFEVVPIGCSHGVLKK